MDLSPPDGDSELKTTFHSNPVIVGELVITGTDGASPGDIYAFDRATGEVRWRRLLDGGQVAADLAHAGGLVLAAVRSGELVALAVDDGRVVWTVRPARDRDDEGHGGSVLVDGDTAYFAGLDQHLYAIRLEDGLIRWTRDLGANVSTSLALHEGALFVGCENDRLYRVDAKSGKLLGEFQTEEDPGGRLLAFPGRLVFLGHEPSSLVAAVDPELSELLWIAEPRDFSTPRPVVWGDLLLVGDDEGTLVALDPATGEERWRDVFGERLRGVGVSGDTIYVGSTQGSLIAYRMSPRSEVP